MLNKRKLEMRFVKDETPAQVDAVPNIMDPKEAAEFIDNTVEAITVGIVSIIAAVFVGRTLERLIVNTFGK